MPGTGMWVGLGVYRGAHRKLPGGVLVAEEWLIFYCGGVRWGNYFRTVSGEYGLQLVGHVPVLKIKS